MEDRYDETTFVDCTPEVLRMTVFVKVHVVTEPEDEEANAYDSAYEDYPRCVLDTGNVLCFFRVLTGGLSGLNGGLLSFHD